MLSCWWLKAKRVLTLPPLPPTVFPSLSQHWTHICVSLRNSLEFHCEQANMISFSCFFAFSHCCTAADAADVVVLFWWLFAAFLPLTRCVIMKYRVRILTIHVASLLCMHIKQIQFHPDTSPYKCVLYVVRREKSPRESFMFEISVSQIPICDLNALKIIVSPHRIRPSC